jgi:PAS domain S-box-containing protein
MPPAVLHYAIAVALVAAAVATDFEFNRLWGINPTVSLFLCAVLFTSWACGTGPAVLASVLAFSAFVYFFLQPVHSFIAQSKNLPHLVLFAVAALFVVFLSATQRRTTASLRQLRADHEKAVQELLALNETLRLENVERRRAEDKRRRAEADLQLTVDTIPVLVARYASDGFMEFRNQAWRDYTGLSQDNAEGRRWGSALHPDDLEMIEREWQSHLATGEPFEVEQRLRRADGKYRWHWVRRVPLRDQAGNVKNWYAVGFDIEDRMQAERTLQRIQAYAAEAQKLSQTGSFAWEVATRDYFWSDQAYQILGFDPSVKPSISLVVQRTHPDDRFIIERELDRSAQRVPHHDFKVRLLMPNGQIKHIHILAHRIKYEAGNEEVVGAVMDITDSKKSQEALDAAQAALAHASRVATLGEISATIAHEVNQPLAAIVANGQSCLRFLRREPPDLKGVRGTVEWIVKDGSRAGEIIRRVRTLLKKVDTEKVPLDLNEVIAEVATLLQRDMNARKVMLQLELAPSVPQTIADRVQLQQVIINLIINGAEAMQEITDRPRLLVVRSYEDEEDHVVIAVKDCGVGIPPEISDRLFDAFFSTKPSGLGVGLSICRSIIEDHGGELWVTDNGDGPGAAFRFSLPACRETYTE